MASFQDVEQFTRQHHACGTITPTASSPLMGGYLLTLTCACGAAFDRWITAEEADALPQEVAPARPDEAPASPPSARARGARGERRVTRAPERSGVAEGESELDHVSADRTTPVHTLAVSPGESLDELMKRALAEVDGSAAPSLERGARDPSRGARDERAPEPAAAIADDVAGIAGATTPAPGDAPILAVSQALDQVMQRALEYEHLDTAQRRAVRETPDRHPLEGALRTAVHDFDEETRQGAGGKRGTRRQVSQGGPVNRGPAEPADAPRGRRKPLTVAGALVIALLLAALAAAWYVAQSRSAPVATVASAARLPALPRLGDADRAAIAQTLTVLRDLHGGSRVDVPHRVYVNRVSFAKTDVERSLPGVKDADVRRALQETLALHLLAASAWRAKTLNERGTWEVVGEDAGAEVCPAVRRVLALSDEPPGMTRAQWRGITLASAIPLLWDCAAERITEVEKALRDR
jgi:hypothetical protein